MSKSLEIDGKIFQTSSAVADTFGYTSDYVSKLAREQKVDARQVGRQWYVDPRSVEEFKNSMESQKELRRTELRSERRRERVSAALLKTQSGSVVPHPTHALAQAIAIFSCLLFVTFASYVTVQAKVSLGDMGAGAVVFGHDVAGAIVPDVAAGNQLALLQWLQEYFKADVLVEETPVATGIASEEVSAHSIAEQSSAEGMVIFDESATTEDVDAVRAQFSDPVEVTFESEDSGVVTPIFRERTGDAYRFLLVPVESRTN